MKKELDPLEGVAPTYIATCECCGNLAPFPERGVLLVMEDYLL